MRKLVVVVALLLSASAARAQADKATPVTKLPGEETLSTRERAERDFLMPIRRKKAAELAAKQPTASAEQLATAAPETDATAHFNEAAPDPRPEEVAAPAHEAAPRSKAARHAAWLAKRRAEARREERAEEARAERRAEARRAARHSSKSSKSSKSSHSKSSAHSSKSSKAKHHTAEKASHSKKTTHHTASKKTKTKTKTSSTHKKHRR